MTDVCEGIRSFTLGHMTVIGTPPAKLAKALAVIADTLHPAFEAQPRIIPGISKESCVLCSLTVRDFLRAIGFDRAVVAPVVTLMWATERGEQLHSLGIGVPDDPREPGNRWIGHMVVVVAGRLIDTTLYHTLRPQWPDLTGMISVPLAPTQHKPFAYGLKLIAGTDISEPGRDYNFCMAWLDNPTNRTYRSGGDYERERRLPVVHKLIEKFGTWREG